jgi:hypothetical protein
MSTEKSNSCGLRKVRTTCRPVPKGTSKPTFRSLIADFRREDAPRMQKEAAFFRKQPSLERAIHHAATATDERGKVFDHQRRTWPSGRLKAEAILTASVGRVGACRSFHELLCLIEELLSGVRGIRELYRYDTAARLGAFLSLAPEYVYLHAGTRKGAQALGLGRRRGYLEKHELPVPLQALTADELETFLCVYAAELAEVT